MIRFCSRSINADALALLFQQVPLRRRADRAPRRRRHREVPRGRPAHDTRRRKRAASRLRWSDPSAWFAWSDHARHRTATAERTPDHVHRPSDIADVARGMGRGACRALEPRWCGSWRSA